MGGIVVAVTVADDDILSLDSEVDVDNLCVETDSVVVGNVFEESIENTGV
jgi:hypothetical protein